MNRAVSKTKKIKRGKGNGKSVRSKNSKKHQSVQLKQRVSSGTKTYKGNGQDLIVIIGPPSVIMCLLVSSCARISPVTDISQRIRLWLKGHWKCAPRRKNHFHISRVENTNQKKHANSGKSVFVHHGAKNNHSKKSRRTCPTRWRFRCEKSRGGDACPRRETDVVPSILLETENSPKFKTEGQPRDSHVAVHRKNHH